MISWTALNFLASSFATFSKASFFSAKGPFRDFHLLSESVSVLFPLSTVQRKKQCFIILCVQSVSLQHFTCSKYFQAGDSCCHRPCIPACLSFSASSRNFFTPVLSWQKKPTFLVCTVHVPSFSIAFHDAPQTHTAAILPLVCLLSPPETCCNIGGKNGSCMIPLLPLSPPTQTARFFSVH